MHRPQNEMAVLHYLEISTIQTVILSGHAGCFDLLQVLISLKQEKLA